MATEEYCVGYDEGYQAGWNAAIDFTPPSKPDREPVSKIEWFPAPIKTQWGHDMVCASIEIDKDHTLTLYCERSQIDKVEAMLKEKNGFL